MADEQDHAHLHLELQEGYRFSIDMGEGVGPLVMDEPAPLGEGAGPNPSAVLGAAIADCLSASLLFCLRRAHIEVTDMATDVEVVPTRNEAGRLRIGSVVVRVRPVLSAQGAARAERCTEIFEEYCVVTESVRNGIDVEVTVEPSIGG